jgi:CRISPR-associated protein Csd1
VILQALVDYYERRMSSADPARRLPALGLEDKEIPFVIELAEDGRVFQLRDTRSMVGKRLRGQRFLVPQGEKKTSGIKANLLWDSANYVIGLDKERKSSGEATPAQAFRSRIEALGPVAQADSGLRAVLAALSSNDWSVLRSSDAWQLIEQTHPTMTFALASDAGLLVCQRPAVVAAALSGATDGPQGMCLVTGRRETIARLHPSIKGVRGAQSSGASLVAFNARAFESYGKTERQGENAPVGQPATLSYTTALNALLDRLSPNRLQLGDATTVVWADRDTTLDAALVALFGEADPDAHVEAIRNRLAGAQAGTLGADDSGLRFFVLGLAPNAARVAIRFWHHETFERLGPRVLQHFDDLRIARGPSDPATPSMFRLLTSLAAQGKADNIPPRLAGEWIRAILEGGAYPPALLNAAVNRCRAEQATREHGGNVPYLRAAVLKACINREYRRRHGVGAEIDFIREALDVNQTDPAYRLGRLFAVLERIQELSARPSKLNATIRDRYYGAASSTPAVVFPTLMRLKNAHLRKLSGGEATHFERLVGEVCGTVEQPALAQFPRQLELHAQGLFALGYYQQRQSFFTRKPDAADNPNQEE